MIRTILFFVALYLLSMVVKNFSFIFLYVILPLAGLWLVFYPLRAIYFTFRPKAKKAYLERKAKEAEENRKRDDQKVAKKNAKRKREGAQEKRERAEARAMRVRIVEENKRKEFEHQQHRDGEQQTEPYTYQIEKHGNESLAIRYGIANQERKVKEYWYHAKGGEKKRNPERDEVFYEETKHIRLQKIKKLGKDKYEVLLTDYRNRKAIAIIEVGTEYVKTFYPIKESWFEKYADLETTLKGNGSFTLKELATFHVQKTVGS